MWTNGFLRQTLFDQNLFPGSSKIAKFQLMSNVFETHKGQSISECLLDFLNFPKKQKKNFVGCLENLRYQKVILKLTDL